MAAGAVMATFPVTQATQHPQWIRAGSPSDQSHGTMPLRVAGVQIIPVVDDAGRCLISREVDPRPMADKSTTCRSPACLAPPLTF